MDQLFLVTWKSLLLFAMLVILTRLIGRKLLAQMSFFDFVIGITIGTIAGAYVVSAVKGLWVLVSPLILALASILTGYVSLKNLWLRKLVGGEPTVVIQNGKILEKNLLKLRYHIGELEMQLRDKGIFDLNQVEFAVLEPHGQLSVLKKSQYLPLTPKDLNLSTNYQGLSSEIIKDGDVIEQNLRQNNLSLDWLFQELNKQGIKRISDVFYATLNTDASLYIDKRKDNMDYIQKIED